MIDSIISAFVNNSLFSFKSKGGAKAQVGESFEQALTKQQKPEEPKVSFQAPAKKESNRFEPVQKEETQSKPQEEIVEDSKEQEPEVVEETSEENTDQVKAEESKEIVEEVSKVDESNESVEEVTEESELTLEEAVELIAKELDLDKDQIMEKIKNLPNAEAMIKELGAQVKEIANLLKDNKQGLKNIFAKLKQLLTTEKNPEAIKDFIKNELKPVLAEVKAALQKGGKKDLETLLKDVNEQVKTNRKEPGAVIENLGDSAKAIKKMVVKQDTQAESKFFHENYKAQAEGETKLAKANLSQNNGQQLAGENFKKQSKDVM